MSLPPFSKNGKLPNLEDVANPYSNNGETRSSQAIKKRWFQPRTSRVFFCKPPVNRDPPQKKELRILHSSTSISGVRFCDFFSLFFVFENPVDLYNKLIY